jgi:signal peptide peptidase SppA
MTASKVEEIRELYYAHTRREKLDLKAWEAATGRPAGSDRQPYQMVDGVAIIPLQGVMTKADSSWNRLCGMTSSALAQQDLQAALDDHQVHSILLWVDSPGGMVDGTQELAQAVFSARQTKPVVALADGCMCSAAYWVGAAAEQIFITSDTTETGSIGVVAGHRDVSASEAQRGVKTTEITAGKYKRISTQYAPLSEDGRASIQAQVDHIYSVFVESISNFRGVSVDTVLADMADGRVFLGRQAIDAGLVDGVSSMADLISQLNQDRNAWTPPAAGAQASTTEHSHPTSQEGIMPITREQLAAEAPELLTAIQAEARAEGAAAETDRIKGCLDASMPGYEPQAMAAALDGKTTPGEAAQAIISAQKADLGKAKAKAEKGTEALAGAEDVQAIEDESARKKAEDATKPKDARTMAAEITAHIAKAAAEGRTLTATQAAHELTQGKG